MNLVSPVQVKAWCREHDFHPNRVLGQNFLVDRNALDAIIAAADLPPDGARVLEIGPGLGVLTQGLIARGCNVVAIEKDPALADGLAERVAPGQDVPLEVVCGDALDHISAGRCDGFQHLVSNLPYQAGTRILLEMTRRIDANRAAAPETMVVLVQTEVAERLAAGPGSKTRGLAGVWAQLDYAVEPVRTVGATCFWPRPAVGSTVVRLHRHHRNDALGDAERAVFRRITKEAFNHRRKQLGTIFKGVVESTARAEELANADWLALAEALA